MAATQICLSGMSGTSSTPFSCTDLTDCLGAPVSANQPGAGEMLVTEGGVWTNTPVSHYFEWEWSALGTVTANNLALKRIVPAEGSFIRGVGATLGTVGTTDTTIEVIRYTSSSQFVAYTLVIPAGQDSALSTLSNSPSGDLWAGNRIAPKVTVAGAGAEDLGIQVWCKFEEAGF